MNTSGSGLQKRGYEDYQFEVSKEDRTVSDEPGAYRVENRPTFASKISGNVDSG